MKNSTLLSLVGVAVIMLVVGTTLGSVYFSTNKIVTTEKSGIITTIATFIAPSTVTSTVATTITTNVTATLPLYQPCKNDVWNNSNPTPYIQHVPVLLMRSNSTAYLCVTYQTAWQGNESLYLSDSTYNSYPLLVNGSYQFGPFLIDNYK